MGSDLNRYRYLSEYTIFEVNRNVRTVRFRSTWHTDQYMTNHIIASGLRWGGGGNIPIIVLTWTHKITIPPKCEWTWITQVGSCDLARQLHAFLQSHVHSHTTRHADEDPITVESRTAFVSWRPWMTDRTQITQATVARIHSRRKIERSLYKWSTRLQSQFGKRLTGLTPSGRSWTRCYRIGNFLPPRFAEERWSWKFALYPSARLTFLCHTITTHAPCAFYRVNLSSLRTSAPQKGVT